MAMLLTDSNRALEHTQTVLSLIQFLLSFHMGRATKKSNYDIIVIIGDPDEITNYVIIM